MDALDIVTLALRLLLVALLYLFLAVVLRTSVVQMRPATTGAARSALPGQLSLLVIEGGASELSSGQIIEIGRDSTVGRGEGADIVLADPAVSAEHARVDRVGRAWVLTDLGSTNGTRVNDAPIHGRVPLTEGDVLCLGTVRLQVLAH